MKLLERTIFKKKNEKIEELKEEIIKYQVNNICTNEQISKLKNKNNLLEEEISILKRKIHILNSSKGGYKKSSQTFIKKIEEIKKSYEKEIELLNNKLLDTESRLKESMTDKYLVRKIRPAKGKQKQTMKIKSGYIEGKIINKIKEEIMKNKIMGLILIGVMALTLTGCTSAETVSYNISRESDEFKVKRRITFVNLRTGDYLFTMTGKCSIQGGGSSVNDELEVVCRIGENKYQKHLLYLAEETTYIVEQLEDADVSRYDYEFIFRPKAIVPIEIKTQVGEE